MGLGMLLTGLEEQAPPAKQQQYVVKRTFCMS